MTSFPLGPDLSLLWNRVPIYERGAMTRRFTAITVIGLCLVLSTDAFAQLKDHIELNVFGAGSFYTENQYLIGYPQSTAPIPGELKFNPHARFGARLGVFTRGHWGQEFYYSFEPNQVDISTSGPSPTVADLKVQVHQYGINALFYPVETEARTLHFFLSAGIGGTAYLLTPGAISFARDPAQGNMPDIGNSNELAFNFGFGFKTRSTGWLGLRFDVRDFVGRTPSFGLARHSTNPTATVLPATGVVHNPELSLGLVFYFNRR